MARQQPCLHVWDKTERDLPPNDVMRHFLELALLKRLDHDAPPVIGEVHRSAHLQFEVLAPDLPPVDEAHRQTVSGRRSELLEQVKRKRWSPRPQDMEEAHLRI
jgi:hypothetical protein